MIEDAAKRALAAWINEKLKPNTIAVATLKQAVRSNNGRWVRGNEARYEHAYGRFIRQLSEVIYGKTVWRRHKKLIPNALTLEGNGLGHKIHNRKVKTSITFLNNIQPDDEQVRWHLNMLFRRPDWMSPDDFHATVTKTWLKSDWAMPDFEIEEHKGKFVPYALKDGPEALLTDSLSF